MNGLLGGSGGSGILDFIKTPEGQGLLSAAFAGMAGARRGQPWNTAGAAGLGGVLGYSRALENQQQGQVRDLQMQKIKREEGEYQQRQSALNSLPENLRNLAALDPRTAIDRAYPAPEKPQLVTVQGPEGPMQRWLRPGETQGTDVGAPVDKEAALPWYVQKGPGGLSIDPAYADLEKTKASFGRAPAQPMAPVAYVDPSSGQTIWGTITDARGKPAANFNPTIQGTIAEHKAQGKEIGEARGGAIAGLPGAMNKAEQSMKLIDQLLAHPGRKTATGLSSKLDPRNYAAGTDATDFNVMSQQLQGKAFLEAFESLKGGGQITQVEGEKATQAIGRLSTAQSEKAYEEALLELKGIVKQGVERSKQRAGVGGQAANPKDAQALEWANANPNDPRAAQIKARLGQ